MPSAKVKYPGLQTAVFEPGDLASLNGTYWLMRFPARWKPRLLTLAGGPGTDRVSIPIRSLNRVLAALVPDLVHVARYATRGETRSGCSAALRLPGRPSSRSPPPGSVPSAGAAPPHWSRHWP